MKKFTLITLLAFNYYIQAQNIGIGNPTPTEKLDVKGNVNISGTIKANGVDGSAGQLLQNNGNGTMSWVGKERFKHFRTYRNDGSVAAAFSYIFYFPANITEVAVEMWGGGGQANGYGGAASGGYLFAIIPIGTNASMDLSVGAGGGCTACNQTGNSSTASITGAFTLIASGGLNPLSPNSQGTFSTSGTYMPNISFFGVNGGSAKTADLFYENTPEGFVIFSRYAHGADAPFRPNTGGKAGFTRVNFNSGISNAYAGSDGSEPGGGGGYPAGKGGHGQIIVYW